MMKTNLAVSPFVPLPRTPLNTPSPVLSPGFSGECFTQKAKALAKAAPEPLASAGVLGMILGAVSAIFSFGGQGESARLRDLPYSLRTSVEAVSHEMREDHILLNSVVPEVQAHYENSEMTMLVVAMNDTLKAFPLMADSQAEREAFQQVMHDLLMPTNKLDPVFKKAARKLIALEQAHQDGNILDDSLRQFWKDLSVAVMREEASPAFQQKYLSFVDQAFDRMSQTQESQEFWNNLSFSAAKGFGGLGLASLASALTLVSVMGRKKEED